MYHYSTLCIFSGGNNFYPKDSRFTVPRTNEIKSIIRKGLVQVSEKYPRARMYFSAPLPAALPNLSTRKNLTKKDLQDLDFETARVKNFNRRLSQLEKDRFGLCDNVIIHSSFRQSHRQAYLKYLEMGSRRYPGQHLNCEPGAVEFIATILAVINSETGASEGSFSWETATVTPQRYTNKLLLTI